MSMQPSFKLIPATTTLSRRQLLLGGMAASATAVLLAAKPLVRIHTLPTGAIATQPLGVFEALNIFLNASRIQR